MIKIRKIGKMSKPNNGDRSLFESIFNSNVLETIKSLDNDLDFILINDISIGYHHKPYMCDKIDILVKEKSNKFNNVNIFKPEDFGLEGSDYDIIKKNSIVSDDINIISPTYMVVLLLKNGDLNIDNKYLISKLIYNSSIDFKIIYKYLGDKSNDLLKFIKRNNKDYMLKYLLKYKQYNTCYIYEGSSGYTEVDLSFEDWISGTKDLNQVLIGGMALVNYDIDNRYTQDVYFLFLSKEDVPDNVYRFKKHRKNAFQHNKTHVEIEVLSNDTINLEQEVVDIIFKTSYDKGDFKIASPSAIVAIKLDRFNPSDERDISLLMKNYDIDISEFLPYLSDKAKSNYNSMI